MGIHYSATYDEHLNRGEVSGDVQHGERCRISSRHRFSPRRPDRQALGLLRRVPGLRSRDRAPEYLRCKV